MTSVIFKKEKREREDEFLLGTMYLWVVIDGVSSFLIFL